MNGAAERRGDDSGEEVDCNGEEATTNILGKHDMKEGGSEMAMMRRSTQILNLLASRKD